MGRTILVPFLSSRQHLVSAFPPSMMFGRGEHSWFTSHRVQVSWFDGICLEKMRKFASARLRVVDSSAEAPPLPRWRNRIT